MNITRLLETKSLSKRPKTEAAEKNLLPCAHKMNDRQKKNRSGKLSVAHSVFHPYLKWGEIDLKKKIKVYRKTNQNEMT